MKRFAFSMQALYDVKLASEKQAQGAYAAARNALDQAEELAQACLAKLQNDELRLEEKARAGMPASDFQNYQAYLKLLRQKHTELQADVEKAREAMLQRQQELQEIYRDKKALERLREEQYQAFMQEQLAKEARETEDLLVFGMMGKMQEARNDPA
jgi:flagellar export protein FliJ